MILTILSYICMESKQVLSLQRPITRPMTSAVDVDSLTSLEDIQAAFDLLSQEEESLVERLDQILSQPRLLSGK